MKTHAQLVIILLEFHCLKVLKLFLNLSCSFLEIFFIYDILDLASPKLSTGLQVKTKFKIFTLTYNIQYAKNIRMQRG